MRLVKTCWPIIPEFNFASLYLVLSLLFRENPSHGGACVIFKRKSRCQKVRIRRGRKTTFMVKEIGFMQFSTDVYKFLKEQVL